MTGTLIVAMFSAHQFEDELGVPLCLDERKCLGRAGERGAGRGSERNFEGWMEISRSCEAPSYVWCLCLAFSNVTGFIIGTASEETL